MHFCPPIPSVSYQWLILLSVWTEGSSDLGALLEKQKKKKKQKQTQTPAKHPTSQSPPKSLLGSLDSIYAQREYCFGTENYLSVPFDPNFAVYELTSNAIL